MKITHNMKKINKVDWFTTYLQKKGFWVGGNKIIDLLHNNIKPLNNRFLVIEIG